MTELLSNRVRNPVTMAQWSSRADVYYLAFRFVSFNPIGDVLLSHFDAQEIPGCRTIIGREATADTD